MMWVPLLLSALGTASAQICNCNDPDSGGNIFPAFSTGGAHVCLSDESDPLGLTFVNEDNTPCERAENDPQLMAIVYFLLLMWTFAGVGVIADVFMDAIGVITSVGKWVAVRDDETGETKNLYVKVWNPTVANLTLMALGSSAPEILLSVIEITSNDFYSGDLGPSTIVGSAAFNGLVIISVCVSALEAGETRRIEDFSVFAITAFSSVFAYVWLIVILQWWTPNIVTVAEGTATFVFFPVLVVVAFIADKGYCGGSKSSSGSIAGFSEDTTGDGNLDTTFQFSRTEMAILLEGVDRAGKSDAELVQIAYKNQKRKNGNMTRADYRKQGTAEMLGSKASSDVAAGMMHVGFECTRYSVKESMQYLEIGVVRMGDLSQTVEIQYATKDNLDAEEIHRATAGKDYFPTKGKLVFGKGQSVKTFKVQLVDDEIAEEDETFLIEITKNENDGRLASVILPEERNICTVTILDDNDAGIISFAKIASVGDTDIEYDYICPDTVGFLNIRLVREEGSSGDVSVQWRTKTDDPETRVGRYGVKGHDAELEGEISFPSGSTDQYISLPIICMNDERDSHFAVELFDPKSCPLGELTSVRVSIGHDTEAATMYDKIASLLYQEYDSLRSGSTTYGGQFKEAVTPGEDVTGVGLFFFWLNCPWRLFAALVPPPRMLGGWLCFTVALMGIAVVTALIGDLASLLGCSIGLKDSITAITLVALGTSLPDTFASKAATIGDENADAAIGNVNGSNSVNVFLGLGLPWFVAAIYWGDEGASDMWRARISLKNPEIVEANPGGGFAVPAGALGFSVMVFCTCQVACLVVLVFRRVVFGAELGASSPTAKHTTVTSVFLACLWFFYVTMSILQTYEVVAEDTLLKVVGLCAVLFVLTIAVLFATLERTPPPENEPNPSKMKYNNPLEDLDADS